MLAVTDSAAGAPPHVEKLRSASITPRGSLIIHSGLPACDDGRYCDSQITINGDFAQCCAEPDSGWISLAFPVQTDEATIHGIRITHNSNTNGGDLYLMDDTSGNPDITKVLYSGCNQIREGQSGLQLTYLVDPPVLSGVVTWVVAVLHSSASFDVAFTDGGSEGKTAGLGFANFIGTGTLGEWEDLSLSGLGYCYCVEVLTGPPPADCCPPSICNADCNSSGNVDPLDVGFVLARLGDDVQKDENCTADVNCDGQIDPLDAGYVLARLGTCDPPSLCAAGGGECTLNIENFEPPENDDCENATPVSVSSSAGIDNTLATTDGPADCDGPSGLHDVWYEVTAPTDGVVLISLCPNDEDDPYFDSTMSVYNGAECPVGEPLACSDDGCGLKNGPSELVVAVVAGQTLKIRVGGRSDGSCEADPTGLTAFGTEWTPAGQGACCLDGGGCITAPVDSCEDASGVYQGDNTACTYDQCP